MVREICKDEAFLAQKAEPATADDLALAQDLLETLAAHKDGCVGMAANMIGVNKRIIAFDNEGEYTIMFNPVIVRQSGPYEAQEGCLSLTGTRHTKRFQTIKVQWQNEKFQTRLKTFTGWTAEIIQHEIDHCEGIIIGKKGQESSCLFAWRFFSSSGSAAMPMCPITTMPMRQHWKLWPIRRTGCRQNRTGM